MIIVLGLIILVAAVVVGVAGVLGNGGSGHSITHFAMFGYHVTGSTSTVFMYGLVLGAVGLLGLSLLLAGARRSSRRGAAARRGLRQSRRETAAAAQQRDDLIDQRETARAYTASKIGDGAPGGNGQLSPDGNGHPSPNTGHWGWLQTFGRRPAPEPAAPAESAAGPPAPGIPVGPPAPADDSAADEQPVGVVTGG